jgi:hypothetical protein
VRELFFFDLFAEYLTPRLQGHRLQDGEYVPIPSDQGRVFSEVLGLWLEPCGLDLLLIDPGLEGLSFQAQQRATRVEEDLLGLLHEFRDLRRKNEKRLWRKQ